MEDHKRKRVIKTSCARGVIITYDEEAFERWGGGVKSYKSARASLGKIVDFLQGKYAGVVRVPIWCIGIE